MPIIRSEHDFEENFTRLPNRWLRDERLSLKAIGLLAQLQSHTVGWKISINTLAKNNHVGLDYIRSAISELEEAGYLVRTQQRDPRNRFAESIWVTADPSSGFPSSGFPSSENPTTKKNNVKNEHKEEINAFFEEFWKIYPRKVALASARKAFLKACNLENWDKIHTGVMRLANDPNLPPAQFVPYPATWINREGWNDEPYPERKKSPEELAAEALEIRKARAEQEREAARLYSLEQERLAAQSAPAPLCPHGTTIVRCSKCVKIMAKSE